MMREEFITLTKVEASSRYYTERIEPEYMNSDSADKQEFCAAWVKKNKTNLCKAHAFDMDALSRDIAMMETIKEQADRAKELIDEAKAKTTVAETELHNANFDNDRMKEQNDSLRKKCEVLQSDYSTSLNSFSAINAVHLKAADELAAAKNEILILKAKLYDLMAAGA